MKVVHISTSLNGGAGLCAKRIITATRGLGIDAKVIVASGEYRDEWVSIYNAPYPWSKFWPLQKFQVLLNMYGLWPRFDRYTYKIKKELQKSGIKGVCVTSPISRYNKLHEHPWVVEADIIHLHWVGNFLDYETFFKNVHKPIVWTIHDENPGLGGFHYTSWRDSSTDSFRKLERRLLTIKQEAYGHAENMSLVAISSMMKQFFEKNELLARFPVTLIYNGIEADKFKINDKMACRMHLGLQAYTYIFIFVAQSIHESRKGLKELVMALEMLQIPNICLLCLGDYGDNVPKATFPIQYVGFVHDTDTLSHYYSAADFCVMPSFQEAFAQTPMEAMACGTPIIAFPCSGSYDLINDRNGVICEGFTVEDLTKGIRLAMTQRYNPVAIREYVINRFAYDKIAHEYLALYGKIL